MVLYLMAVTSWATTSECAEGYKKRKIRCSLSKIPGMVQCWKLSGP